MVSVTGGLISGVVRTFDRLGRSAKPTLDIKIDRTTGRNLERQVFTAARSPKRRVNRSAVSAFISWRRSIPGHHQSGPEAEQQHVQACGPLHHVADPGHVGGRLIVHVAAIHRSPEVIS
jgi:hypothetical protein